MLIYGDKSHHGGARQRKKMAKGQDCFWNSYCIRFGHFLLSDLFERIYFTMQCNETVIWYRPQFKDRQACMENLNPGVMSSIVLLLN